MAVPSARPGVVPLTVGDWLPTLAGANFTFYLERTLPVLQALHAQHGPVALVGHSAGGWIARILLGDALYDGKKWNNLDTVSSLLTLGAPHQSLEQYPFGRIKERRRNEDASLPDDVKGSSCRFVTHHYPNASDSAVPVVCCVGKTVKGVQGPLFDMQPGAAAYISYKANAADGATWGDGVCPMRTAIVPGAQLCVLEGVWHSPLGGRLWYGSAHAVQYWDRFLPASSPSS